MDTQQISEPDNGPEKGQSPRRSFFKTLFGSAAGLGSLAFAATSGLWAFATGRFFWPNVLTEPPMQFSVGKLEDYPEGHVETRFKQTQGVWIVNGTYKGKPQIYALDTTCTHLGCITVWQEGERKFKCPCHGSGFYIDGINFEGPAPRPLARYAIRLNDEGLLEIDKSRMFQEELGQWTNKACYIEV
jgi:cytochrome b6-f complex iron-sulfur subunit